MNRAKFRRIATIVGAVLGVTALLAFAIWLQVLYHRWII